MRFSVLRCVEHFAQDFLAYQDLNFTCLRATLVFVSRFKEPKVTNLTIALDENVIRQARIRAIGEGTSVSAKVREFLAQYANATAQLAPVKPVKLRVFSGGSGLAPGIDPSSNKSYLEAMGD